MCVSFLCDLQRNMNEKEYEVTSDFFFQCPFLQVNVILTVKLINITFLQND